MERETKEFTTKQSKIKYTIYTWLTKAEKKAISRVYNKLVDFSSASESISEINDNLKNSDDKEAAAAKMKIKFDLDLFEDYRDELVKQSVVSVNEKTDGVFDEIMQLRSEDADEIYKTVEDYFNKKEKDFLGGGKK